MSFCHLYSNQSSSLHVKKLIDSFEDYISLDIDKIKSIDDYDAYVIELNEVDKEISAKLKSFFKNKGYPLIYFIIPKKYSLMLFQLTYLLNTKDIITQNQNTDKVIAKIKSDIKYSQEDNLEFTLGNIAIETQSFIVYKNSKLSFVSSKLLNLFKCNDLDTFKKNILNSINIEDLLKDDKIINESISNNKSKKKYIFESLTVTHNEKIIYVELDNSTDKELNFISSRVSFIEILKEKLIQRDMTSTNLSAITISIENIKKLQEDLDIVDVEDILNKLLLFIESILVKKLIFSQFEKSFYVILFDGISYDEVNAITDEFHANILNYIIKQKYKPVLDIFTYDLDDFEFGEILITIDNIKTKNFTYEQNRCEYIQHTSNTEIKIDEKAFLDDAFENDLEFKILNIYNGLVINTPSKILKVTNDTVYITFEQLQGVVINIEKETVLQSSSFLHDILAEVKQIDLKKRIAVLENFKFLKTNANSRQYARVTTSSKIPISIFIDGITINGHILDLSIKSIAIKVKHTQKIEEIKSRDIQVSFNIPNTHSDNGYTQLKLGAEVIMNTPKDSDGNSKVICDLDEDSNDENLLMEYVYQRQKELIVEVKKMSKLN